MIVPCRSARTLAIRGSAYIFPDSVPYISGAAVGFETLFGWDISTYKALGATGAESPPKADDLAPTDQNTGAPPGNAAMASAPLNVDNGISTARSIYFGAVAFLSYEALGNLGLPVLNALVLTALVALTAACTIGRLWVGPCAILVLSLLTPLPFFVCFLMPDLYAGITILCMALIFAYPDRLKRWTWVTLAALLCVLSTFHTGFLLLIWASAAAGALLALIQKGRLPRRGLTIVLLATVSTIAADRTAGFLIQQYTGAARTPVPFLASRLIADGPGYRYLEETCPQSQNIYCAYLDRMPAEEILQGAGGWYATTFLWSPNTRFGVYNTVSVAERRQMGAEQFDFTLAVVRHDPLGVAVSSLCNTAAQMAKTGLSEFYDLNIGQAVSQKLGADLRLVTLQQDEYRAAVKGLEVVHAFAFWGAICFVIGVWLSVRKRQTDALLSRLLLFGGIILFGLLANAAIHGTLSGAFPRYQARVLWLPVLAAILILTRPRKTA